VIVSGGIQSPAICFCFLSRSNISAATDLQTIARQKLRDTVADSRVNCLLATWNRNLYAKLRKTVYSWWGLCGKISGIARKLVAKPEN